MAFISTGLLLCSMPKPWQRCPLPIIHSLPIPERGWAGWLPSTLALGLEETMCWNAKRWKRSWGCEAPNRCIPWGDNGVKSHLARKHMQDLRRKAGAGVCLPRTELTEGQGNHFRNLKVEATTLKTHKDLPPTITIRLLPFLCTSYLTSSEKNELLCPRQGFVITNIKSIFLFLLLHRSLCLVIWGGREPVRLYCIKTWQHFKR